MDNWTGELIGKMHNAKVNRTELAEKIGCKPAYITMILNGRKNPKGIKERLFEAFEDIVKEKSA